MNPACRLNLDSPECEKWMTAVIAHCGSILPNAEQASLWDSWWPDELPAPYKTWVSTMSAFDCHRVRKEVANQVDGNLQAEANSHLSMWSCIRWTMAFLVLLAVLIAMFFALRMVIESCSRKQSVESSTCPPMPKSPKAVCCDVESPPCLSFKKPMSYMSFGQHSDPLTGFASYRYQKLVKTNSVPDCKSKEQKYTTQAPPSSRPSKPSEQSSRKKKSAKK